MLWEPHNVWFSVIRSVVDLVAETKTHSLLLRERIKYLHRDSMLMCLHAALRGLFFPSDNVARESIYYLFASVHRPTVPTQTEYVRLFTNKSPLHVAWTGCTSDWILLKQKCLALARHFEHVGCSLSIYPYSRGKKKIRYQHNNIKYPHIHTNVSAARVNTEICLERMFKLMEKVTSAVAEIVEQRQNGAHLIIDNCGDLIQNLPTRYAPLLLLQFFKQLQLEDRVALCKLLFKKYSCRGNLCKILKDLQTKQPTCELCARGRCEYAAPFLKQLPASQKATTFALEVLVSCETFPTAMYHI